MGYGVSKLTVAASVCEAAVMEVQDSIVELVASCQAASWSCKNDSMLSP